VRAAEALVQASTRASPARPPAPRCGTSGRSAACARHQRHQSAPRVRDLRRRAASAAEASTRTGLPRAGHAAPAPGAGRARRTALSLRCAASGGFS
jgi:hypothetical protein